MYYGLHRFSMLKECIIPREDTGWNGLLHTIFPEHDLRKFEYL